MYNRVKNEKFSFRFIKGLEDFFDLTCRNNYTTKIRCLCKKCKNRSFKQLDEIKKHILRNGFVENYYDWKRLYNLVLGISSRVV